MATLANLISIYRNVHRLPANVELPTDATAQLTTMANGIDAARQRHDGGWLDLRQRGAVDHGRSQGDDRRGCHGLRLHRGPFP